MGFVRLISKREGPAPKPSTELCRSINALLNEFRSQSLKLKGSALNDDLLISLSNMASKVNLSLAENAKSIRSVGARELRESSVKLLNRVVSLQEIEDEHGLLGSSAEKYKTRLVMDADDISNLFLSVYEIDLSECAAVLKPKKDEKKKDTVIAGPKVMHSLEELKNIEIETVEDVPEVKKKSKSGIDFEDNDTIVMSKYKPFAKQIRYEDEFDIGLSFMKTMPLLCISNPPLFQEAVADIVTIDNLSGYAVFPNQLMVGIEATQSDSVVLAKDNAVAKYVLTNAKQYLGGEYEVSGPPRWIKNMICFWLIDKTTYESIRRKYPRFLVTDWTPVMLNKLGR